MEDKEEVKEQSEEDLNTKKAEEKNKDQVKHKDAEELRIEKTIYYSS